MSRNQTGAPPITRWLPLQSMINSGADIPRTNPLLLEGGWGWGGGPIFWANKMLPLLRRIQPCTQGVRFTACSVFRRVKLDVAMATDDRSPITTAVLHSWVWRGNCEKMSVLVRLWCLFVNTASSQLCLSEGYQSKCREEEHVLA